MEMKTLGECITADALKKAGEAAAQAEAMHRMCIVPPRDADGSPEAIDALLAGLDADPVEPVNPDNHGDPLARNGQGHWFWDETWSQLHGPYASEAAASAALSAYAATL